MELIENVIKELQQINSKAKLDIRVTYTHAGVKVNIRFISSSGSDSKRFPTLKESLLSALKSYRTGVELYIHRDFYQNPSAYRDPDACRRTNIAMREERIAHLVHVDNAIALVMNS